MDVTYNSPSMPGIEGSPSSYDYLFSPTSIGYGAKERENSELSGQLKGSRLWFKTRRKTEIGLVQSLIEADFGGSTGNEKTVNSHNIRMRHAYMKIDNLTIGQSNSLFMGRGNADTVVGGVDMVLVRQPLIHYKSDLLGFKYGVGLESAESTVSVQGVSKTFDDDRRVDISAFIAHKSINSEIALAWLNRELRANQVDENQTFAKTSNNFHLSGRYRAFGRDSIRFSLIHGSGVGRYMALNYYTAGVLDNNGVYHSRELLAYHVAYQHFWSKTLRSSLLYSKVNAQTFSEDSQKLAKVSNSIHLNLRYSPFKNGLFRA